MSKNTLNTILKLGALAAVVYGAYKFGEYQTKKSANRKVGFLPQLGFEEVPDTEEIYISKLIRELEAKSNKTKKDKNNIELLQVKLKQLKQNI